MMGQLFSVEDLFCLGLLSMAQQWEVLVQGEIQAHEVAYEDPDAAQNSCNTWAEQPLPFLLPHIAYICSVFLSTDCHEREVDSF